MRCSGPFSCGHANEIKVPAITAWWLPRQAHLSCQLSTSTRSSKIKWAPHHVHCKACTWWIPQHPCTKMQRCSSHLAGGSQCSCLQEAYDMAVHCCTITHHATQGHRSLHLPPFHACQCCPEGATMSSGSSDLRGHVRCRRFEVEAMVRPASNLVTMKATSSLCQKCQGQAG